MRQASLQIQKEEKANIRLHLPLPMSSWMQGKNIRKLGYKDQALFWLQLEYCKEIWGVHTTIRRTDGIPDRKLNNCKFQENG